MQWRRSRRIDEWATAQWSACRRYRVDRVRYGGTVFWRPMQFVDGSWRVFRHGGRIVTHRTRKRAVETCERAEKARSQLELFA
jgi:hypothetical protein